MDPSHLFSSRAKYLVLRVLCLRRTPLHLRALSEQSKTGLRSVQLAVNALERAKLLHVHKEQNRKYFLLDEKSAAVLQLRDYFSRQLHDELALRAKNYPQASSLFERINELRMLSWRE